jgi:hypothetical protein
MMTIVQWLFFLFLSPPACNGDSPPERYFAISPQGSLDGSHSLTINRLEPIRLTH